MHVLPTGDRVNHEDGRLASPRDDSCADDAPLKTNAP